MKEPITITNPVRATIVIIAAALVWAAIGVAIAKADEPCDGFPSVDGCVTLEDYNAMFSYDVLSNIESLTFPGQSVADVYGITDDGVAPVDRPRDFMGVSLPTIRWIIGHNRVI